MKIKSFINFSVSKRIFKMKLLTLQIFLSLRSLRLSREKKLNSRESRRERRESFKYTELNF